MKQAVILAGGKGTRLRDRLGDLPKPMIDICGTPLIERQILLAKRYGFTHILILVNYRADKITEFCASRDNWGLSIRCIDDGEPLGTAGATLKVYDDLADEFLLIYGDTMLEVDLDRFHAQHSNAQHAAATLFLHPNDHPHDSDLVDMNDDGDIVAFHPYPHDPSQYYPNLVNAALYWIRKSALRPWLGERRMLDFGKDLFPAMLSRGLTLRGYNSPEYIKDCGTPARVDKVSADLASGKIARSALTHQQAAVFLDRDGTLNREVDHLHDTSQLELLPGVGAAIRKLNRSEYRCCVVTNQPVIARGECTVQGLRQIHNKLETQLGNDGAFVDRIYYCPHHPDKGFPGEVPELKISCTCRKPAIGLIEQAVSDLNIACEKSWMIGDTSADMLTARRAGLKSILVETGYAGLDQKYWATPDFVVPDLPAAVDWILRGYPRLDSECDAFASAIEPGQLVLVGGLSRSGKSSFASALRYALARFGKRGHVISTDRWLLDEEKRGKDVLARHDLDGLREFVRLVTGARAVEASIPLPGYKKIGRKRVDGAETLILRAEDVIIVEGVIALHFAEEFSCRHSFFIDIDEQQRMQRVLREYDQRNMGAQAAESIYRLRLVDEVPLIEQMAKAAAAASNVTLTRHSIFSQDTQ